MSTLSERLTRGSSASPSQVEHARRLVADWQLLADLSFADLTLWVPLPSGAWWCVAQVRPLTAPTSRPDDLVGTETDGEEIEPFLLAFRESRPVTEGEPDWSGPAPRRREVIPVRHEGTVVAVLAKDTNLAVTRSPSTLELTYLDIAADLCLMVSAGTFPPRKAQDAELSPRVGDGLVRLDSIGRAIYASPNALSAYRRLGVPGDLVGADLWAVTAGAAADRVAGEAAAAGIAAALDGRFPDLTDVESRSATVFLRALPLRPPGERPGALVLVRDVTDVRSRERALLTKDATIREIHHRVKNNLQTVASLLRLQARRLTSDEAKVALAESVRRIASIALVHETLSQDSAQHVSFDKVAERLAEMLAASLSDPERPVRLVLDGSVGDLPAEVATPLALVLSELVQNSLEHAFRERGGTVRVVLARAPGSLHLSVRDDGVGVAAGFDVAADAGLGLQIASTLVESELGGVLTVTRVPDGGTSSEAVVPLST